jgi:hypothetical protein
LEHLSVASFLGKLLVLPANVRLDWKVIARYKQSSLIGLVVSNEGKKFYNMENRIMKSLSPTTVDLFLQSKVLLIIGKKRMGKSAKSSVNCKK